MDPHKLQATRIGLKKALAYLSTASVCRDPAEMAEALKHARAGIAEASKALGPAKKAAAKKAPAKKKAAPKKKAE
jgi:hypothetical protein